MKEILKNKSIYIISFICIIIDQIIKLVVSLKMNLFQSIEIISNFFSITYVKNDGAAFSILSGNRFILIIITILAIYLTYKYLIKDKKVSKLDIFSYGILYGGIIGNLIDRLFRGIVIDYLDFKIFGYDFPVFNLADTLIVIAIVIIGIKEIRGDLYENSN